MKKKKFYFLSVEDTNSVICVSVCALTAYKTCVQSAVILA